MTDKLTPLQRHKCMSHIRSANTKPEVKLRKELFRKGYRYRVNDKHLPGKPDIVLRKYHSVIFVNGCFWHGHKGCSKYVQPKSNVEFWVIKVRNNQERDLRNYRDLEALGWRVIVVWECELTKDSFENTISNIVLQLDANRQSWVEEETDRKKRRKLWKEEQKKHKLREIALLKELL